MRTPPINLSKVVLDQLSSGFHASLLRYLRRDARFFNFRSSPSLVYRPFAAEQKPKGAGTFVESCRYFSRELESNGFLLT